MVLTRVAALDCYTQYTSENLPFAPNQASGTDRGRALKQVKLIKLQI